MSYNYIRFILIGGEYVFKTRGILDRYKIDSKLLKYIDITILLSSIIITLFGLLNIYLCTKGGIENYPPLYFIERQGAYFIVALIIMYFILAIDYRIFYRYIDVFYWVSIVLLIAVWIPGIGLKINGARGWIRLGITNFQPSEMARIAIILKFAKILDEVDCNIMKKENLLKIAFYIGIPMILILIQKDMGMTMVCFFIILGMIYIAGIDKKVLIGGGLALITAIIIAWNIGIIHNYQKERITSLLDPEFQDTAEGYQLYQGLIGIGSGGILGIRPTLKTDVVKGYAATHVPEIQTDFIFSTTAENWGFIGAISLLGLYALLIYRIIYTARKSKDRFASLVCVGIASYFLFAITQNIGMLVRLLPITGITLPLMSYGGTSLVTTMMMIALVINIGMRKKEIHF